MTVIRTLAASPRGELTLLFLASCSIVAVLVIAMAAGGPAWFTGAHIRLLLLICLATGLGAAMVALLGGPSLTHSIERLFDDEAGQLRRSLAATEAVLRAEPQILVVWERGARPLVMAHTLNAVAGLPQDHAAIESFGQWLDIASARDLKSSLDQLFATGKPFNVLVRTTAGAALEADGRATGGRVMLRLRDVAGFRKELAEEIERRRVLDGDLKATRAVLDAVPSPIWIANDTGRVSWANTAYVAAAGATSRAEVERTAVAILETRQRQRAEAVIGSGQVFRERLPLVTQGAMKAHDVTLLPLDGASAGIAIDVAAVEAATQQTDRNAAAHDRVLHRVSTGIAIYGRDQRLTFFNDAYRKIWKLDADWLAAKPSIEETLDRLRGLSRLPQVGNYRDWKAKVLSAYRTSGTYEDWWHLIDGRHIHVMAERRADGGVAYMFDDQTERLALEASFKTLIDTQRDTLDSLKEGVALYGPDGRLRLFNKAFAQLWRLSPAMLSEGPHIDEITRQSRILFDDEAVWQQITSAVTAISDRRAPAAGKMERPDELVIEFRVTPLPDGGTLATFADITDSRRKEFLLEQTNNALAEADNRKSEFLGLVSYHLRTPLTNIIGFTEMLAQPYVGDLNDKQREYLGDIAASSQRLHEIINDILDQATLDAGSLELKIAPAGLPAIIDAALLGVRERAKRARVQIDVVIEPQLKTIVADEARVRQILFNLLSNAISASKSGDTIRLACVHRDGDVEIVVQDQGKGIPREQQERVFGRFESYSHARGRGGPGLGLTIARSLAELHGGKVTVDSEPGKGARFTLQLPKDGPGHKSLSLAE